MKLESGKTACSISALARREPLSLFYSLAVALRPIRCGDDAENKPVLEESVLNQIQLQTNRFYQIVERRLGYLS